MQSTRSASMMLLRISPSPDWFGGHGAVGEDEAGDAGGREVVDDVLHPGEVGVADGRHAELPAHVVAQALAAPVADR